MIVGGEVLEQIIREKKEGVLEENALYDPVCDELERSGMNNMVLSPDAETVQKEFVDPDHSDIVPDITPEASCEELPEEIQEESKEFDKAANSPETINEDKTDKDTFGINSFESKITDLKTYLDDLQEKIDTELSSHSDKISQIYTELDKKTDFSDIKVLRKDFNVFSKRLWSVAKEADAARTEVLDAAKIPPEVLEIAYTKTLNDMFSEILNVVGEREGSEIVRGVINNVRESSAGVDFFKFENGKFQIVKLAEAIEAKLVSPKQIHATYIELFKKLSEYIPSYESRDFKSFVETGSREYAIEKIAFHTRMLQSTRSEIEGIKNEILIFRKDIDSYKETKDQHIDEIRINVEGLLAASENIKSLVDAINSHTRIIKRLNENIDHVRNDLDSYKSEVDNNFTQLASHISNIESMDNGQQIQNLSEELNSLKENIGSAFETADSRIEAALTNTEDGTKLDQSIFMEEFKKLQEDIAFLRSTNKMPIVERIICETLRDMGNATVKQLEKQMIPDISKICDDDLLTIVEELEMKGYLLSEKRGRHTYYAANI